MKNPFKVGDLVRVIVQRGDILLHDAPLDYDTVIVVTLVRGEYIYVNHSYRIHHSAVELYG